MKVLFGILLMLSILLMASCSNAVNQQTNAFLPDEDSIGEWLLSEKLEVFSSKLGEYPLSNPTGLTNEDYLKIIGGQVRVMQQYQDTTGKIVDPVENVEKYFTTPCYAHSVAVLASSAYTKDADLIESGMKALDNTCEHLRQQTAPGNHGDFFTWPVMFAIKHFEGIADSARYNRWRKIVKEIKPEKLYAFYNKFHINWNLVHASGEYLRHKEGFTGINYVDTCLYAQKKHFTDYGMYDEGGNPLAYDLFSRHYLMGVLAFGYNGKHAEEYKELLWKGAWMSLFMQSPTGEAPTGYRSSHHIWNEAEQAMIFEIMASQYAIVGNEKASGVFKRGAMLSLQNIRQWIRPDGSGYIVKNKFPIEAKFGYEGYSVHSCYNMLATSMLAQAYEFAANISESHCPADIGGYVLPIIEPFHKIFASLDGNYVEYDTKGDQKYNPTGIIRVHIKGANPQLGPSDGIASLWNSNSTSIALGPLWQNTDGSWTPLAKQEIQPSDFKILEESDSTVAFQVRHNAPNGMLVTETVAIQDDKLIVTNSFTGHSGKKRITWPLLMFDGKDSSAVNIENNHISIGLNGKGIVLELADNFNGEIGISNEDYNHRNGVAKVCEISFEGDEISYTLSAK